MTELKYKPPVIVLGSDINKMIEGDKDSVEYVFQNRLTGNFQNAIESLRKAIFS